MVDFDPERLARSPFAIGAVGGLIAAVKFMPGTSWPERAFNVFAGSMAAGFGAPLLVAYLRLDSPVYLSGAAFLVGLVGMSLVAALLQGIKDTPLGQIITGWISRRGG